jgi:alpha-L-fucosidase
VSELVDIYYRSIGRNGNLILNLSPDNRGLIPDDELDALSKMSQVIKDTFATDLAAGGKLTADNSNKAHKPSNALDGNLDTWWEAAPGKTNGGVDLDAAASRDLSTSFHCRKRWTIAASGLNPSRLITGTDRIGRWRKKFLPTTLTTVGHRRLIRLKSPVTSDQVRIRITGSRLEPTLAEIGLFKQSVARRLCRSGQNFRLHGTSRRPTRFANRAPTARHHGFKIGWKVVAVDSQETAGENNAAANAIDGNASTFWHTALEQRSGVAALSHR